MSENRLKYNLRKYISQLPQYIQAKDIITAVNVNRDTYYKWLAIKSEEERSIPSDKLHAFAAFFTQFLKVRVTVDDLYNTEPVLFLDHIKEEELQLSSSDE